MPANSIKKADAEPIVRALAIEWRDSLPVEKRDYYSWSAFTNWLVANNHSNCLNFRSRIGANYDAEMWFDDEMGQSGLR